MTFWCLKTYHRPETTPMDATNEILRCVPNPVKENVYPSSQKNTLMNDGRSSSAPSLVDVAVRLPPAFTFVPNASTGGAPASGARVVRSATWQGGAPAVKGQTPEP